MTRRQTAQRALGGLATGVFVTGSAVMVATLLLDHSQDYPAVGMMYIGIYPLFLGFSGLLTIGTMFLMYRPAKAVLLALLVLLVGGSGYVLLTVLLAVLGVLTGDGANPDALPVRGATAFFVLLLFIGMSACVLWLARRVFQDS